MLLWRVVSSKLFFFRTSWKIASCRWVLGSIKDLWVPIFILFKNKFNKNFGGEFDENIFQNILIVAGFELWTWHKGRHWAGRQARRGGAQHQKSTEAWRHEALASLIPFITGLVCLFVSWKLLLLSSSFGTTTTTTTHELSFACSSLVPLFFGR